MWAESSEKVSLLREITVIILVSSLLTTATVALVSLPSASYSELPEPDAHNPVIAELISNISLSRIHSYIYDLQNFTTRYAYTDKNNLSAQYIMNEFGNSSYLIPESQYFVYDSNVMRNVYAILPGFNPANRTKYIISGHFDSISQNSNPWLVAPGADDDASGVAATMEAARVMSRYKFNATLIFGCWNAEELGLIGSDYYARQAAKNYEDIGGVIQLDMIGYDPTSAMGFDITSDEPSEWIMNEMVAANSDYGIGLNLYPEIDPSMGASDHASFWDQGYEAVMGIEHDFNAYYHTNQDTVDKLNMDFVTRVTKMSVAALAKIAGILTPGVGEVAFNRTSYRLVDTAEIHLYDTDLNRDPLTPDVAYVNVTSETDPVGAMITLTETGNSTDTFVGVVNLLPGPISDVQPRVFVSHGDTLTATYLDDSPSGLRTDTASIDGAQPRIWNVAAAPEVTTATITWRTDEPSDSLVEFGVSPALGSSESDPRMFVQHQIFLSGLSPNTTYFFLVRSVDEAGNVAMDDNGGLLYTFKTMSGLSVTPQYGYVGWVRHTESTGNHFTDPEILVGHSDRRNAPEGTNYKGAAQFFTTPIPSGATITNASVRFYGERWIYDDAVKEWWLRQLNQSIDENWTDHAYPDIDSAAVDGTIPPTLTNPDLEPGKWNYFYYQPDQYEMLRDRVATGKISYRIDGFDQLFSADGVIYSWRSGNDGDVAHAPRLTITYSIMGDAEGPLVESLDVAPNPSGTASSVRLYAVLSDASTGNSDISYVEYYVESDPGLGNGFPMSAVDGGFDSPTESATVWLDISGWTPGFYTIYVRGRDVANNWGPSGSIILQVGGADTTVPSPPMNITAHLGGPNGLLDVTITWTLSSDDLSGQRDVVAYYVYESETYNTSGIGYELLGSIPAGYDQFVHPGGGHGDIQNHFYRVVAVDAFGNSADGEDQAGKIAKPLGPGPRLLSVPLIQEDWTVEEVLKTLSFNWVRSYDAAIGEWRLWFQAKHTNTLSQLDLRAGVWVDVNEAYFNYLTVAGTVPKVVDIELRVGWNLVSYPSFLGRSISDALAGIIYEKVQGYDETSLYHLRNLDPSWVIFAGDAIWIQVSIEQSWRIEN